MGKLEGCDSSIDFPTQIPRQAMQEQIGTPYISVNSLTKLMAGEHSCEWAAWFKARHESEGYQEIPSDFDATIWQTNHTALLDRLRTELENEGKAVSTEDQNRFSLKGSTAILGGKPDLITACGSTGTIYDAKTGKWSPSHHIQLMIYMYAIPKALYQYNGVEFEGKVVYEDREVLIPNSAIDHIFVANLGRLIRRVSSEEPAIRVPSAAECSLCNITISDCPERSAGDFIAFGETGDL